MRALSFAIGSEKRRSCLGPNEPYAQGRRRQEPLGFRWLPFPAETWTRVAWRAAHRCLTGDHPAHGPHQLLSLFVGIGRAAEPPDQAVTDVAVQ